MASSEMIMDSGRASAVQKSNFSQTCSLLSQYLKENGSFGDLSLGLNRNFEPNGVPAKTMNLLSTMDKSGQNLEAPAVKENKPGNLFPQPAGFYTIPDISVAKSEPDTAQMTIFYGGQVLVFNDFPAEKAREIMLLASNGSPLNFTPKPAESATGLVTPPPPAASNVVPSFGNGLVQQENVPSPLYPRINDLPLSRKASLTRFLEKRKDRITAKAPYQMMNNYSSKAAAASDQKGTWLGFGQQFPANGTPSIEIGFPF